MKTRTVARNKVLKKIKKKLAKKDYCIWTVASFDQEAKDLLTLLYDHLDSGQVGGVIIAQVCSGSHLTLLERSEIDHIAPTQQMFWLINTDVKAVLT